MASADKAQTVTPTRREKSLQNAPTVNQQDPSEFYEQERDNLLRKHTSNRYTSKDPVLHSADSSVEPVQRQQKQKDSETTAVEKSNRNKPHNLERSATDIETMRLVS